MELSRPAPQTTPTSPTSHSSLAPYQEAAAVVTGISVATYQKIENGHRMPRLENLVKLLRGLETDAGVVR